MRALGPSLPGHIHFSLPKADQMGLVWRLSRSTCWTRGMEKDPLAREDLVSTSLRTLNAAGHPTRPSHSSAEPYHPLLPELGLSLLLFALQPNM